MPELDESERAYLAAFVAVNTPSASTTHAALGSVHQRLAAGDIVELPPQAHARDRRRVWIGVGLALVSVAAAVVLLLRADLSSVLTSRAGDGHQAEAAYAGVGESEGPDGRAVTRQPVPPPERAQRSVPAPLETIEPPETIESPEVIEPPEGIEPPSEPASSPKPARSRPVRPAADATLHAEMALLRPAQQALRAGHHARALRLLDDHARSFPSSALAEERSLSRIIALCGVGKGEQARREAATFGRRHPGSPLTTRAQTACVEPVSP